MHHPAQHPDCLQAGDGILARISHHPTTAMVPCHALWAFYSVRVLDIVSTMPAGPLVVKPIQDASFDRLATKSGEKCGLTPGFEYAGVLSGSGL